MKADQKFVSRDIVIILILFSLTTILGCKGDSWDFDLFGGDPTNQDGEDSGGRDDGNGDGNNGNDGDGISAMYL
jgi:hypothetical protein